MERIINQPLKKHRVYAGKDIKLLTKNKRVVLLYFITNNLPNLCPTKSILMYVHIFQLQ